jgi:hypothetical protein
MEKCEYIYHIGSEKTVQCKNPHLFDRDFCHIHSGRTCGCGLRARRDCGVLSCTISVCDEGRLHCRVHAPVWKAEAKILVWFNA